MKAQRGFTLIELVVVIVILGILAATAIPKFVDLSSDAGNASAKATAAAIASAATLNYAKAKASGASAVVTVGNGACSGVNISGTNGLLSTFDSAHLTVGGTIAGCGTAGAVTNECTVTYTGGTAVSATLICTQ